MSIESQTLRTARQYLRDQNKLFGPKLREIPEREWPENYLMRAKASGEMAPRRVWRSREFCVQLFLDRGFDRLSVNRTEINSDMGWKDGITWDDLMRCKSEAGYGDRWAVECYPPDAEVVNVACIRHLFILKECPAFGWADRHPAQCAGNLNTTEP